MSLSGPKSGQLAQLPLLLEDSKRKDEIFLFTQDWVLNFNNLRIDVIFVMFACLQQLIYCAHEDGTHCLLVWCSLYENAVEKINKWSCGPLYENVVDQPPAVAFTAFTDEWTRVRGYC